MTTPRSVDFFVIGGGSGGVRAARIAAGHGARVMVAEEFRLGGTCVIRGCVPKKLMVYASRFADAFEDARGFGWSVGEARFDWSTLVAGKEREITRLSGLYRRGLESAGALVVDQRAVVDRPGVVRLADGTTIEAQHILIATGGHPARPSDVPGIDLAITSNEIFDLAEQPPRLLIVGGGYIAVEFASIFARLGTAVTLVIRGGDLLRGFDSTMAACAKQALEAAGVTLHLAKRLRGITQNGGTFETALSDGTTVASDQVLLATGRHPNTRGLGLEEAGVALDRRGAITVDPYSRSSVPGIFAVGDVTDRLALTPVAIREGHALADTLFGGRPTAVDHAGVPSAVFITPEIASVGLTQAQALEAHPVVDLYEARFRPLLATLSGREERVVMKMLVEPGSDRVLGVHVFGHEAGEMIQLAAVAMKMGARKADFDATLALHPTAAEELVTMRTRSQRLERVEEPASQA